jgi:hypothetical protein
MMMTRKAVLQRASHLGAVVETDASGRVFRIRIEAPPRHIWSSRGVHELVSEHYTAYDWNDAMEGMADGVRPCKAQDCDWCADAS